MDGSKDRKRLISQIGNNFSSKYLLEKISQHLMPLSYLLVKIFNLHVDVYLVFKMFDFYFLKVKVDYLYLNKNALKPKKIC